MWTKQHQAFCSTCGRTTNNVTHYLKDDDGRSLTARVHCAEHKDAVSNLQPGEVREALAESPT